MKRKPYDIYLSVQATRRAKIQRMLSAGKTQSDIARSLGVSRQAIHQIVVKLK